MNELNASSIESALTLDMAQLEKDLFAINSKQDSEQSDTVKEAMKEASAITPPSPQTTRNANAAKVDRTRDLMKKAGLI